MGTRRRAESVGWKQTVIHLAKHSLAQQIPIAFLEAVIKLEIEPLIEHRPACFLRPFSVGNTDTWKCAMIAIHDQYPQTSRHGSL